MNKHKQENPTINFITLGCSKNIVDSESLMNQLKQSGFNVVYESYNYTEEIVVINTCGFINDAKQESIDTILDFIRAKQEGKVKKVYVMGCLSERYKESLSEEIPEVDMYFGVKNFKEIVEEIHAEFDVSLIGQRVISTPKHYAYLKISEGCDWKCSFCAIPLIRGKHISKTIEAIIEEATFLANQGVKELILIAQDLTYYGLDIYKKRELAKLLLELEKVEGIEWIRLHYLYPAQFPMEVLDVIAKSGKICKYIDIPFQHISSRVLYAMDRRIDKDSTIELINTIKIKVPNIAIRTSFIAGFPDESEDEFNELYDFVKESKFDRMGVFTYSHEEDTKAFKSEDNIPEDIKQERCDILMGVQQDISLKLNQDKIGKTIKVLVDREDDDYFVGRTEFDSPEIDNEVLIEKDEKINIGNFYNVKINDAGDFDLYATLVD